MKHLATNLNFDTSELRAINQCCISKGIFFLSNICNHQGTHLLKSAVDNYTPFSLPHDFNWPSKQHTLIASWRTWSKSIITLCNESKFNLHTQLGQWVLENDNYISSWKWFLFCDLRTLRYREHKTWWK